MRRLRVVTPADLDGAAVLALAAGGSVELGDELIEAVARRRTEVLAALADGGAVYGVTTGMGAFADRRLTTAEQADQSKRLMLARAVGGPPYLDREEARALVAVRLRGFLEGDAGVSVGLCAHLVELLAADLVPSVPRTGSGAAGEILPLAHAWGHLAGVGPLAGASQAPALGAKEGIALLAGVPTATALALLRARDLARLHRQSEIAAAGSIVVAQVSGDPYDAAVARGDTDLADELGRVRALSGPSARRSAGAARHLQAPVSFRVIGPVLANLSRETERLRSTGERMLGAVTDSPAYLPDAEDGPRFVGTAGFHGVELAAAMDSARAAVVHAAATAAARVHRLLDPVFSGLPAQLSADPGPQAGLTAVHKRLVAAVHEVSGWPASTAFPAETSGGQEDVQSFALEAAERLRLAIGAAELVLAGEVLAVHQARLLSPTPPPLPGPLRDALDRVVAVLPAGVGDRPWGEDLASLVSLLRSGW